MYVSTYQPKVALKSIIIMINKTLVDCSHYLNWHGSSLV